MTPSDGALDLARAAAPVTASHALAAAYRRVREATLALAAPLSAEDQTVQSMPDASPVKWHQAHTSWFFETFILAPHAPGYSLFDPLFGYLFNSYYEAVGPRRPRPARGQVTRPSVSDVRAYRRHVDEAMLAFLETPAAAQPSVKALVELGLAHEEQHQELILMDVLHLFAQMPGWPTYEVAKTAATPDPGPMDFVPLDGGIVSIGHEGPGFAFDNEGPRHEVLLAPYALADRLVTNAEWIAFIEDGGYRRPELWLSDGWVLVQAEGWSRPIYWEPDEAGGLSEMTLGGRVPLDPHAPAAHISFYEAEAYARWAGKRLPSEAEWEHAATAAPFGALRQMQGSLWQWTSSPYGPYPGFQPGEGAIGEYNGKFMINQVVLRGGCLASPPGHVRPTYRNFFYPHQRWQFSGIRLAGAAPSGGGRRARAEFCRDVLAGLAGSPKRLPSKYFYDDRGSLLFEAICELEEYYPTRQETALLRDAAPEIAKFISKDAALIEFGSGASVKTRLLLDAAPQVGVYIPMDISQDALDSAAAAIRWDYPDLEVAPLVGDFTQPIHLPRAAGGRPRTGFFPGSTIGNFTPSDAVDFLRAARRLLGQGAQFIVGVDLVKPEPVLVAAYDDARRVTADFNLNLLARINRELDGGADLANFSHRAVWNAQESRMEMHLVSRIDQAFGVAGEQVRMSAGETIHTENSYKFTQEGFADLADQAGWRIGARWISPDPAFAVFLLQDGQEA